MRPRRLFLYIRQAAPNDCQWIEYSSFSPLPLSCSPLFLLLLFLSLFHFYAFLFNFRML